MRRRNYRYAFVTFSHADEAKLTSILMETAYLEDLKLNVVPKIKEDHRNYDKLF